MEGCCYTSITSSSTIFNLQGGSYSSSRRYCTTASGPQLQCSLLAKPFLQLKDNYQSSLYRQSSSCLTLRSYRGIISAEAEKKVEKLTGPAPSEPLKPMEASGIVLVAGATGGVGRRVVDVLRKKGLPVRVLVRNEEKAKKMLGPDVDMIVGDITKANTLLPDYFKGVKKIINAVSVIVGPKEGDTPDRAKYSQGIKFFEPEIKGDSPEMVEYIGMKNLINAIKESVAQ